MALLLAGGLMIVRRERLAARARQRQGSAIHAPMGYLVLGGLMFLNGVGQLVLGFV
jgi:hypothetical protein